MNDKKYITTRKACKALGVCEETLRRWSSTNSIDYIRTPGGQRRYCIDDLKGLADVKDLEPTKEPTNKKYCYCRVSSQGQKDDLERQVSFMREQYPNHTILTDIGSGINFKRRNLRAILELSSKGLVEEVVVAYRDRLCRFAFELIEWFFQLHGVKLVVLNETLGSSSNSELAEDLLAFINVFNCRVNGRRKYKKENNKEKTNETKESSSEFSSEDLTETFS